MRHIGRCTLLSAAALTALACVAAAQGRPGDVVQSIPPSVSQKPTKPPLHLSDAQRAQIRAAVGTKDTETTFQLKTTKPAKDFAPKVGAAVPKSLKLQALPRPLIYQMPALKNYGYLKLKHQVLIVDPMTRKVVDVFPEASG